MRLTRLELQEFRAYRHACLDLPPTGLRLFGRNASGKSSLLEAIYLLATTRSPRSTLDREMINWSSNEEYGLAPFARVVGRIAVGRSEREVEIDLVADASRPNITRKRAKVDGRVSRAVDVVGTLKVVLFEPEDLNLVLGSPSIRRRYLDISLSQLDRTYLAALTRYGRVIEHRNSLLKDLAGRRDRRAVDEQLSYWDGQLTTYGAYILAARYRYLRGLSEHAARAFADLSEVGPTLTVEYAGTVSLPPVQVERIAELPLDESQSLVARALEAALAERRDEELRRGVTVVGPHRDDVTFQLDGRSLSAYGSRGQQRLGVVAVKLAELGQVLALAEETPVLLLDDVLSELDAEHQGRLLGAIGSAGCQIIITGTARELLEHEALRALPIAEVRGGTLHFG